jgi:protein SCO1/2
MSRAVYVALLASVACGATALRMPQSLAAEPVHQHALVAPAEALSGESIYQLDIPLTTADAKSRSLAELRGRPVLITMFYTSCQGVCPLLAFSMRRMVAALSETERARLRVVMVSFDPARDTPEALKGFGALHKIDTGRWWIARTPDATVRELAAVLGVRYREASPGVFSHSAVITLLDAEGRIVARTTKLDTLDQPFMDAMRSTLASR